MPFNVGDKIKCIRTVGGNSRFGRIGEVFEVVEVKLSGREVRVEVPGFGRSWFSAERFELVEPASQSPTGPAFNGPYRTSKVTKTWIIAVLDEAGFPQPNPKPAVYSSERQAHAVAKSMAEKHPGETFMVFESTAVAAVPVVTKVELVRL